MILFVIVMFTDYYEKSLIKKGIQWPFNVF